MKRSINIEDELKRLKFSFPNLIGFEVENLLSLINISNKTNAHWGYKINVEGYIIEIPIRLYWDEVKIQRSNLSPIQKTILACILTRHHNGYIRGKYLSQIIKSKEYWVMPYLIQLLGEYVVELLDLVWDNFDYIDKDNLQRFIEENELFWYKTKQRIMSYWNCYHKWRHIPKDEYVGFKLIAKIEELLK